MLLVKRQYIVCLRGSRIGAKHVFVSVAAVAYVSTLEVLYASHVLARAEYSIIRTNC